MPKNTKTDSRTKISQHATKRKILDTKDVAAKKKDNPTKENNMAKAAKAKENPNIVVSDTNKSAPVPTTNKRKPRPPQLQPPSNQNKRIKLGPTATEKPPTLSAANQNNRIKLTKTVVTDKPSSVNAEQPPKIQVTIPPPALLKVMVSSGSSITTSTTSVSSEVSSTAKSRTAGRTDVRSTDVLLKLTDQYRMEITDLKQALASEKAAVRTLR